MAMPGRTYAAPGSLDDKYRYSHNGQEKDNDIFIGALSAEYWEYDSRTGRRWENDPIDNPTISPYACFANSPIAMADPDGLTPKWMQAVGAFIKDIFKSKKNRQRYGHRKTGRNKHGNKIGSIFMKVAGVARKAFTGAKYARRLIPQGKWVTGSMIISGSVAPGSFNQVDFRKAIANMGPFMEKVTGISGAMWNGDAYMDMSGDWHEDGNIGGYARVVGMRNGAGGRGWHGLHLNTGFRGFMQNRSDKHLGGVDVGAELIPGINFAEEFLNSGISLLKGNLGKLAATYGGPLMIFELINKQVMFPGYSGTTSLRVINSSITKHTVEYAMVIRYRYWQPVNFNNRSWLWKLFHKRVKKA